MDRSRRGLVAWGWLLLVVSGCGIATYHPPRIVPSTEAEVSVSSASGDYTLLVATTEVSQAEYRALMGDHPSWHSDCADCPVERVSWYDAVSYANARSDAAGLPACYVLHDCAPQVDGNASSRIERRRQRRTFGLACADVESVGPSCTGYRLPTRVESRAFHDRADLAGRARDVRRSAFFGQTGGSSQATVVGRLRPNRFGLYDTYGNVEEWLDDRMDPPPDPDPVSARESAWRGTAGGCLFMNLRNLRAEPNAAMPAAFGAPCIGFRLVRTAPAASTTPSDP